MGGPLGHPQRWSRAAFDLEGRLVAMCLREQAKAPTIGETPAGVARVSAVFVDPGRRRQGIASHLLTEAEQAMLRDGCHLAHLWTPEYRPPVASMRHMRR